MYNNIYMKQQAQKEPHDQAVPIEAEETSRLKRLPTCQIEEETAVTKKKNRTYDLFASADYMFPKLGRSGGKVSLTETSYVQNSNKTRFYLSTLNDKHFLDPERNMVRVRSTADGMQSIRSVKIKEKNDEMTICRMIPGRNIALAGDNHGHIYYMSLQAGQSEVIDHDRLRGTVLQIAFYTPNRFLIVGQGKQCSVNSLEGFQVRRIISKFEDSQYIRKVQFLDSDRFIAGESFHNIRLFDAQMLRVNRKIQTTGSVYALSRLDSNVFGYGGSNDQVIYYDIRTNKQVIKLPTQQNWTGVIKHIDSNILVFGDWRSIVLADLRKGVLETLRTKSRSGIWDACLTDKCLIISSSDCNIVKVDWKY